MIYTQEQIDRANEVNLEQFLCSQGEQIIKSGNEYRWKRHDSLTINDIVNNTLHFFLKDIRPMLHPVKMSSTGFV